MGLFNIDCPHCGKEIPKESRFCPKCGSPVSTAKMNTTCPTCGKELPAGANFCSSCGTKITAAPTVERTADSTKTQGKNREWARVPGDFAQRFEIFDLKGIFSKKFTVEQGERAIFLEGGVYKGALFAGVYNFGSVFSQFNLQNRASLIIVDAGTVPVYFQIPGLRTKNSVTVSASGKVTAQIKDFPAFLANYLKHEGHVSLTDIEKYVSDELKYAAQNVIGDYTAEELIGNAALVSQIEGEFRHLLSYGFRNRGIEILGVSCIGFDEGAWKEVTAEREKLSVEVGKARTEFERKARLRDLENADAVDEIEGKAAVDQAQQTAEHKYVDRELDHTLETDDKITKHNLKKRQDEFGQDLSEISQLKKLQLDSKERALEIERENERLTLENRSNASVEALISILGGNNPEAKEIAKLELEKRAASLTEEQILAIQSVDSPAAAEALKAKYSAEEQKEFNKRTEEMYRENAENMKEVMNTALNAMGSTATARATAQNPGTTVVSGGLGAPVVIGQKSGKKCTNCGVDLAEDDVFCPECGMRID